MVPPERILAGSSISPGLSNRIRLPVPLAPKPAALRPLAVVTTRLRPLSSGPGVPGLSVIEAAAWMGASSMICCPAVTDTQDPSPAQVTPVAPIVPPAISGR